MSCESRGSTPPYDPGQLGGGGIQAAMWWTTVDIHAIHHGAMAKRNRLGPTAGHRGAGR